VKLSETELQVLRKALKHNEKNLQFWPKFRWFQLAVALLLVAASIQGLWRMETLADISSLSDLGLEESKLTELVDQLVEVRTDIIRAELRMHIGVVISGGMGLIVLTFTLLSWRGNAREIALSVTLRRILSDYEEQQVDT